MKTFGKLLTLVLIFQITFYFSFTAFAQNNSVMKKFYVGMDSGVGFLRLSRNNLAADRNTCFSLGFNAGVIPLSWLRTGINLNGYLIESYGDFYDDPSKGISISNFYGQVEIFPFKNIGLYTTIAGGFSKYINMHPDEFNANGTGAFVGLGYEKKLIGRFSVTLMLHHGIGRFKDVKNVVASVNNQHYAITEFLIGINYH